MIQLIAGKSGETSASFGAVENREAETFFVKGYKIQQDAMVPLLLWRGNMRMAQSRSFKLRQADNRPNYYDGALPEIDRKRATAVLVRQSKTGADTAQAESRETQLGLQNYGRLL